MLKNVTFSLPDAKKFLMGEQVLKKNLVRRDGGTFEAYLYMKDEPSSPCGPSIEPDFSKPVDSGGSSFRCKKSRKKPAKNKNIGKPIVGG